MFIPIEDIYGFTEGSPVIADHPLFPNPRTTPTRHIVEGVKKSGTFFSPITLYKYEDVNIILDGKSRATGAAEHRAESPESPNFREVDTRYFQGDFISARAHQIRMNLPEVRENLTDAEQALAIKSCIDSGATLDTMCALLGWDGRGGISKINKILAILYTKETPVLEAFVEGGVEINEVSTIMRENISTDEKVEKIKTLQKAKDSGKNKHEARKEAHVPMQRITTKSWKETLEYAKDIYPSVKSYIEADYKAGGEEARMKQISSLGSAGAIYKATDAFLDERVLITTFDTTLNHLRQDKLRRTEKMQWIEDQMSEDQKIGMSRWELVST